MKDERFKRTDGRYLEFEEVTEGSVILVDRDHEHNKYGFLELKNNYPFVSFLKGDIWVVEALANRPRVAIIRNLQRNVQAGIRIDALLELDDKDILTIGPGPDRQPREDD